jgi:hypothetical protein
MLYFYPQKKANLLFCEHLWRLLLIYASQPSAKASITSGMQLVNTGVYFPANIHITHISGENHGR